MKIKIILTRKPLLSGHLWDLPKCPLNRGCKNCAMFVNALLSAVTLYCDKVPCCYKGSYPEIKFITFYYQLWCAFHKHANSEAQKPSDDCVFRCRQSS